MDSVTHILAGSAMGYAASERYGKAAAAAVVMASVAPNLDMALKVFGDVTSLEYHRVITNSLPGMIVLSLICALVAGRIWKDGGLFKLWSFAFASISVHVIFDLLNSYGAKPFWPFYDKWYALDSVFIIDPLITVPIIVAIVLMKLGRNRKVVFAALAAFMVFYIGGRVALHGYAVRHVMAANPEAISVGAFPSPFSPLKWRAVVEHPDGFVAGWYDLADGSVSGVEASLKPVDTDILSTAQEAKAVEVFLDFARFPLATVNEIPGGWEVSYTDLRFSFGPGDRRFIASVIVNDNMSHGPGDFKYSP